MLPMENSNARPWPGIFLSVSAVLEFRVTANAALQFHPADSLVV